MPAQIVMDSNGASRYYFDASDVQGAVAPGKRGQPGQLLPGFDENVEETLFVPHLVGG